VNTLYLLGALASAAVVDNSHPPYRRQTAASTFGGFGATVGGDAGKNIFRQYWPYIHQMLEGHSPKVLQRSKKVSPEM
jgi:hypothetical protein